MNRLTTLFLLLAVISLASAAHSGMVFILLFTKTITDSIQFSKLSVKQGVLNGIYDYFTSSGMTYNTAAVTITRNWPSSVTDIDGWISYGIVIIFLVKQLISCLVFGSHGCLAHRFGRTGSHLYVLLLLLSLLLWPLWWCCQTRWLFLF